MRFTAAVCFVLLIASPALSQSLEDREATLKARMEASYQEQLAYEAARAKERHAERVKRDADQKALCARLEG